MGGRRALPNSPRLLGCRGALRLRRSICLGQGSRKHSAGRDKVFLNNPRRVHKDLRWNPYKKLLKTLSDRLHMDDPDIQIAGSVRRSPDNRSRSDNANGLESLHDE